MPAVADALLDRSRGDPALPRQGAVPPASVTGGTPVEPAAREEGNSTGTGGSDIVYNKEDEVEMSGSDAAVDAGFPRLSPPQLHES